MNELLEIFPFIAESKSKFEHYNKLLNKVTLTGKINSDSSTGNLFLFTDTTNNNFKEIKDDLTRLLLAENIKTLTNELHLKADTIIDILIRNLFERTADVGFLATDTSIIEFLNNSENTDLKQNLASRLHEYVLKYSVYNEVILFDTKGNVKLNLNQENKITATKDPIIQETLKSDTYVERVCFSDIFASQKRTLTYTQKIVDNGVSIGVLCLCFKFDDELQTLFNEFKKENETILLVQNNTIIASSNPIRYKPDSNFKTSNEKYKIINKSLFVCSKTNGYQGYTGLPWYSVVIRDTKSIATTQVQLLKHSFINQEVQNIIDQADNIVEDLADIIINGEELA